MGADRSAYDALGLAPGASRRAVEEAYRRLIKQYHPDREGGDASRAAEITKAYRELRQEGPDGRDVPVFHDRSPGRRVGRGWQVVALMIAILLLLLALLANSFDFGFTRGLVDRPQAREQFRKSAVDDPFRDSIDLGIVDTAVSDAREIFATRDEMALADASRTCRMAYRAEPAIVRFDRCAAFDDAAVMLLDRDPMRDQGPFREIMVLRRQWSDARLLTNDSWAIDGRLDRIGLRVELLLAPRLELPEVPPVAIPEDGPPVTIGNES